MQTPAEQFLIERLTTHLRTAAPADDPPVILNIGAGRSVVIEERLSAAGYSFLSDRIDVEPCAVRHSAVRNCWQCSIEERTPAPSAAYCAAFANYVVEHLEDLDGAAREVFRLLAPGGIFVATLPNTTAPEFVVAKYTPLWFHKLIRRDHGWETHYAYRGIHDLLDRFTAAGFHLEDKRAWSFLEGYLWKYPVAGVLGRFYDKLIGACNIRRCMGNVCLVFTKPDAGR